MHLRFAYIHASIHIIGHGGHASTSHLAPGWLCPLCSLSTSACRAHNCVCIQPSSKSAGHPLVISRPAATTVCSAKSATHKPKDTNTISWVGVIVIVNDLNCRVSPDLILISCRSAAQYPSGYQMCELESARY